MTNMVRKILPGLFYILRFIHILTFLQRANTRILVFHAKCVLLMWSAVSYICNISKRLSIVPWPVSNNTLIIQWASYFTKLHNQKILVIVVNITTCYHRYHSYLAGRQVQGCQGGFTPVWWIDESSSTEMLSWLPQLLATIDTIVTWQEDKYRNVIMVAIATCYHRYHSYLAGRQVQKRYHGCHSYLLPWLTQLPGRRTSTETEFWLPQLPVTMNTTVTWQEDKHRESPCCSDTDKIDSGMQQGLQAISIHVQAVIRYRKKR